MYQLWIHVFLLFDTVNPSKFAVSEWCINCSKKKKRAPNMCETRTSYSQKHTCTKTANKQIKADAAADLCIHVREHVPTCLHTRNASFLQTHCCHHTRFVHVDISWTPQMSHVYNQEYLTPLRCWWHRDMHTRTTFSLHGDMTICMFLIITHMQLT